MEGSPVTDLWLANNDRPPDQVIREVHSLLEKPTKERMTLDIEIQILETHLKKLRDKRSTVDNTITCYRAITSPIRRVPVDILREIFLFCLVAHRNPLMLAIEAPVLLTHICSSWRAIALSFPLLWSRIHISFTDQDLLPNVADPIIEETFMGPPRLPRPRIIEILRLRCEAVEEWLRRSGTCPLSFSVHYTKHHVDTVVLSDLRPKYSDLTKRLFKSLAGESSRWKQVELLMPQDIYWVLAEAFGETTFTNLVTLRVTFFDQAGTLPINQLVPVNPPPFEIIAPKLERYSVNFTQLSMPTIASPWETLKYLSIHLPISLSELLSILKRCRRLVHLKIFLPLVQPSFHGISVNNHVAQPASYQDLNLPELRSLHVFKIQDNYVLDPGFFDSIISPQLKIFSYRSNLPFQQITAPGPTLPSHRIFPPICALLLKSTQLTSLTLDMHYYLSSEIITILESASSVTRLILKSNESACVAPNILTQWDFRAVFCADRVTPAAVPLLPNLNILEFLGKCRVAGLSEKSLLEFLIRRTSPSPPSPFATLWHVRAVIHGKPRLNVLEELHRHLKEKGFPLNLKLQLSYTGLGNVTKSALATSPAFELAQRLALWKVDQQDEYTADWAVASGNNGNEVTLPGR